MWIFGIRFELIIHSICDDLSPHKPFSSAITPCHVLIRVKSSRMRVKDLQTVAERKKKTNKLKPKFQLRRFLNLEMLSNEKGGDWNRPIYWSQGLDTCSWTLSRPTQIAGGKKGHQKNGHLGEWARWTEYPPLWLATRAGKMVLCCLLGITQFVLFAQYQACLVKKTWYWPRYFWGVYEPWHTKKELGQFSALLYG